MNGFGLVYQIVAQNLTQTAITKLRLYTNNTQQYSIYTPTFIMQRSLNNMVSMADDKHFFISH